MQLQLTFFLSVCFKSLCLVPDCIFDPSDSIDSPKSLNWASFQAAISVTVSPKSWTHSKTAAVSSDAQQQIQKG